MPVVVLGLAAYAGLLFSALLQSGGGFFFGLLVALVGVLFSEYFT